MSAPYFEKTLRADVNAIIHDNLNQVRALLDQGANPNERRTWDRTPLFWARGAARRAGSARFTGRARDR